MHLECTAYLSKSRSIKIISFELHFSYLQSADDGLCPTSLEFHVINIFLAEARAVLHCLQFPAPIPLK